MPRHIPLLCFAIAANALCYDGGGNFDITVWPRCVEASPLLSVYSGLSADGKYLKLGLHATNHSKGWSAIGFSGNGGMKGASQIVVRLNNASQWVAEDRYSLDYVTPTLDPQQDVQLIFAQDNGANISWGVLLTENSCDINDYPVDNISHPFIWALGASHDFVQHTDRGQFHANLLSGIVPFAPLTGVTSVDLKMPNVSVVSASNDGENPYICGIFDLRQLVPSRNFTEKVHVAKFSPFVTPGATSFLHHMILYECDPTATGSFVHGQVIASCQSMPAGCTNFKWVWAVGSPDVQLPDDVGMPLGAGNYWVALQVHYYNPQMLPVKDNSGVTLTLPPTNRPIDAGIMQLNGGTSNFQRADLTANTLDIVLAPSLIIPSACTSTWSGPITIAGAVHHMHLVGTHEQIEVSRNGSSLGVMRRERIYDFKHQSLEAPLITQLLPGDEIRLVCDYATLGKGVATAFGENTDNEMCWSALMFYPAQSASNFLFYPAPAPTTQSAIASLCQSPSQAFPQSFSACTQYYFADPASFVGPGSGMNASFVCNVLPSLNATLFRQLVAAWPAALGAPCPSCYLTANCTVQQLLGYGQTSVCAGLCDEYSMSVYPDVSRPFNPSLNSATACSVGSAYKLVLFQDKFPALPACVANGNLNNTAETKPLISAVLANQAACPNAAIKNVFANCALADLNLTADNKTHCRQPCHTATAALVAAFTGVVPAPSADQIAQCLTDYNTTWAPFTVDGASWTQFDLLLTRLQQVASPCDVAIPSVSSASQKHALFALIASVAFVLFTQ